MPFIPQSELYILRVPWDNTYKHVRLYESDTEQETDMKSMSVYDHSFSEYTYIRWNNAIRVGNIYPEDMQHANYVMFKNANTPNAVWSYAFIKEANYLNDKVAELVLETDVWQTYMFDIVYNPQFVVRQHVNVDNFYNNLQAEPDLPGQLWEYNSEQTVESTDMFTPSVVVVATTADVEYYEGVTGNEVRKVDQAGGIYNGIPSGLSYYAFNIDTPEWNALQMVRDLNRAGAGDAIGEIFMFPVSWIPSGSGNAGGAAYATNKVNFTSAPTYRYVTLTRPTTISGFTPVNAKTLHYPYNFLRIQASTGEFMDVEWEQWETNSETKTLRMSCAISPNAQGVIMLDGHYRGVFRNPEKVLTFPVTIKVPWNYGSYANWSAQNKLSNILQGVAGAAMLAIPGGMAVRAGSTVLKTGIPAVKGALSSIGSTATATGGVTAAGSIARHTLGRAAERAVDAASGLGLSAAAGGGTLASLAGTVYYQSHQANTLRGTVDAGDMYAAYGNKHYVEFKYMQLEATAAYQVDAYFSTYGYAVNRGTGLNLTGRALWNYVQTKDCCLLGKKVPTYALRIINSSFDAGVFLWHVTNTFGSINVFGNTIV